MTSDSGREVGAAPVFWITGLAGVGKSTLAQTVVDQLRRRGHTPLLLDGDAVRVELESVEDAQVYHAEVRLHRAWRLAKLARIAALQGIPVVVATISLFDSIHAWNRSGDVPYVEVLLDAAIESLRGHRPALYGDEMRSPVKNVVGLDIPAEFPRAPELVIVQDFDWARLPGQAAQVLALWTNTRPAAPVR